MSDEMDCDVCSGTGKPVSGLPCICGGTGSNIDEKVGLRRKVHEMELQNEELKKEDQDTRNQYTALKHSASERIAEVEREKSEMADHAVRLRVCLIMYGKHSDRCAMFPMPSGKDCDCGLEANIQAVPGQTVEVPKQEKRNDEQESERCDSYWDGQQCELPADHATEKHTAVGHWWIVGKLSE